MTTVTDADRDAAADYFELTNDALRADFARGGKYDMSVCVQAFARHREAEVVKIVAWLRKQDGHGYDDMRADLIEAGEHHERG